MPWIRAAVRSCLAPGEAGVSVTAAQVRQDEQGLPAAGEAKPPGADTESVNYEKAGEGAAGCGWTDQWQTADKHAKLLADR